MKGILNFFKELFVFFDDEVKKNYKFKLYIVLTYLIFRIIKSFFINDICNIIYLISSKKFYYPDIKLVLIIINDIIRFSCIILYWGTTIIIGQNMFLSGVSAEVMHSVLYRFINEDENLIEYAFGGMKQKYKFNLDSRYYVKNDYIYIGITNYRLIICKIRYKDEVTETIIINYSDINKIKFNNLNGDITLKLKDGSKYTFGISKRVNKNMNLQEEKRKFIIKFLKERFQR